MGIVSHTKICESSDGNHMTHLLSSSAFHCLVLLAVLPLHLARERDLYPRPSCPRGLLGASPEPRHGHLTLKDHLQLSPELSCPRKSKLLPSCSNRWRRYTISLEYL